jgi:hypothetical protein
MQNHPEVLVDRIWDFEACKIILKHSDVVDVSMFYVFQDDSLYM